MLGCVDSREASEFDPSEIDEPEESADLDEDLVVVATSELSGDSGEDVDLAELVLDAASAPELLRVESPAGVSKTGDRLAEREPVLLDGLDGVLEVAGCVPLPSAIAGLVEAGPGDESLVGFVATDGVPVWGPLETGEGVESDLATGGLDGDALAVFSGVLVAGSALAAVAAVGVCADGTGFVAVVVGVSARIGNVVMGDSTVGVSAGAVGVDNGVSVVDPGVAAAVDVGGPTVPTGLSVTIASVDDGGSARIGISVRGSTVEGVDVAGDSVVVGFTVAGDAETGVAVSDGGKVPVVGCVGVAVLIVSVAVGVVVGSSARIGTSLGKSALVGVGAAVVVG